MPLPGIISIKHLLTMPQDDIQTYWQTLYMEDMLKYRLCNIVNPAWAHVRSMISHNGRNMYCILIGEKIVGEFMFENYTGKAVQMHFSFLPKMPVATKLACGKEVINTILYKWNRNDNGEDFARTVYGLVPKPNRAARLFGLRVGFKLAGILPHGMNYMGNIVDACVYMVSVEQ